MAIALEKHDVCSLACVFLTDTASGQLDGLLEDVSWLVYVRLCCFWKGGVLSGKFLPTVLCISVP